MALNYLPQFIPAAASLAGKFNSKSNESGEAIAMVYKGWKVIRSLWGIMLAWILLRVLIDWI